MRKNTIIIAALSILAFISCQKESKEITPEVTPSVGPTSFIVSLPETKTTLEGRSVLWADNDEIRVFGYTEGESVVSAVFQFTGVNEDNQAVFGIKEGESLGAFSNYYAAYPAMEGITVSVNKEVATMAFPRMNSFPYNVRNQRPAGGQFDPKLAIMTATFDGERLVFRHGVGYVKITVPYDDVTSIDVNFTNNCVGDTPTYNLETGALSSLGNSAKNITGSTGSTPFVKGQTYYLAAIPRSGYSIGTTTVSYTIEGESDPIAVSTTHFSGKNVEVGKIFDLGSPAKPTSPKITYTIPSKLDFDAESGSFAFNVQNPVEGVSLQAQLTEGDWIDANSISVDAAEGTVSFTCSKNDAADAQERTAKITLSYTGAEDVVVTITQGIAGSVAEEHDWYFTNYTDTQMTEITGLAADVKATAGKTWDFGDGLTMVTNSSSKWNKQTIEGVEYKWVATGGKYGSGQKYFSFTTNSVGTLTILYASGGSASRALAISAGGKETVDNANVSTSTSDLKTVTFTSVSAGTVLLYSKDDNVRIYRISFQEK
ncbi:MAG: BACON domain-containing protein [Bacteroidales bacterium]|nr:BACON domain-containing protein [Bacteroidales bacterium]